MPTFGTNTDLRIELSRRRKNDFDQLRSESTARFADDRYQWRNERFDRVKSHLISCEVVSGTEFIYTTKHMPGKMLCRVKSVCKSMNEVIEFEVIASDVVMRVLPTSMSSDLFVLGNFTASSYPDFIEMKSKILAAYVEWTQKDLKAEQARKEKVLKKKREEQERQTLVKAYHAEIKDKGFIVGGSVMSPVGQSVIMHFNHSKLTVVVVKVGQALPRAYKTRQLSPFTG